MHRVRKRGTGGEFEKLRPYVPGDEFRKINWKATARRGRPVTADYETEKSQSVRAKYRHAAGLICRDELAAPPPDRLHAGARRRGPGAARANLQTRLRLPPGGRLSHRHRAGRRDATECADPLAL